MKYMQNILLFALSLILCGCCLNNQHKTPVDWDVCYKAIDDKGQTITDNRGRTLYYFEKIKPVQLENGNIIYIDAYTGDRVSPVRYK